MSKLKLSFKWFGSFSNLTFRRSSDKPDSRPGSSRSKDGRDPSPVEDPRGAPGETTMDDLGAMRPRTASYVRSSDDFSHVGTLPRLLTRKRDKSAKGPASQKKSKDKSRLSRSQSQRPAGDYVCSSPLLTALSEQPQSPARPRAPNPIQSQPLPPSPPTQAKLQLQSQGGETLSAAASETGPGLQSERDEVCAPAVAPSTGHDKDHLTSVHTPQSTENDVGPGINPKLPEKKPPSSVMVGNDKGALSRKTSREQGTESYSGPRPQQASIEPVGEAVGESKKGDGCRLTKENPPEASVYR
ncbi:uncharacterized protein FYW47_014152 [Aplochiton taeniatus]